MKNKVQRKACVLIVVAPLLLTTAGCSNTEVIREKDAIIAEQQVRIEACRKTRVALDQELEILKKQTVKDKAEAQSKLQQSQEQLENQVAIDQKLLEREKELRNTLASDIKQKNIEIENLKGRLAVKVLDKILFRSGSVEILPKGQEVLTRVANSLSDADENLRIEGHTDDVPIGATLVQHIPTNWELSVLRAASVVRFLEANNIDPIRLSAAGYSEFQPVAFNTDDASRQFNRRVEIVVVP